MVITANVSTDVVKLQDKQGRVLQITCQQGQCESVAATLKAHCNRLNIVDVNNIDLHIKAAKLNVVSVYML